MALPYKTEYYRRVGEAYLDPDDANLPATGEDIIALVTEVERLTAIARNLIHCDSPRLRRKIGETVDLSILDDSPCDCGVCDTCSSLVEKHLADKGLGLDGRPIR